jgi:cell division septation protein DedD
VQLGASPDQKVALKLEAKARAAGFDVHVLEVDLGAKGTWYRVRVGSFASKEDAAKVQQDAERQLRAPAMVMPAQ